MVAGWIAAILAVVAGVVSAAGALYQGQQTKKAANYQANANAALNKMNADTAQQQAAFDAEQTRLKNKRMLGAQRAAYSASGLDPDSGSALEVQQDSATEGELEALTAIYTGRSSANASNARARFGLVQAKMEGNAAVTGSYISAGGSLLGGAAQGAYYAPQSRKNPSLG